MSDSSILRADLCPDARNLSEKCFKLNLLQPGGGQGADDNGGGGDIGGGDGDDGGDGGGRQGLLEEGWQPVNNTDINFQLPLDLSCEHCVLRLVVREEVKKRSEWRICSDISIIGRGDNLESRKGVVMSEALPKGLTTITRQIENIEKVLHENVKPINLTTKLPQKKITTIATTTTTPTTKSTLQRTETDSATATKPHILKPTSQTKAAISTTPLYSTTSTRAPPISSTSSKLSTRLAPNLVSSPPPQVTNYQVQIVDHPQSSTSAPHQTSDNVQASTLFSTTSRPPSQATTSTISTLRTQTTSDTMRSISESTFGDGSSLSPLADVETSTASSESNWTQDLMRASRKKSAEILEQRNDSRMDSSNKVLTKENLKNDTGKELNLDDALLEDEMIKELLDKSINATVSIEDPLTGENKTVIIQVLKLKVSAT